jgi:hypothetical protein
MSVKKSSLALLSCVFAKPFLTSSLYNKRIYWNSDHWKPAKLSALNFSFIKLLLQALFLPLSKALPLAKAEIRNDFLFIMFWFDMGLNISKKNVIREFISWGFYKIDP